MSSEVDAVIPQDEYLPEDVVEDRVKRKKDRKKKKKKKRGKSKGLAVKKKKDTLAAEDVEERVRAKIKQLSALEKNDDTKDIRKAVRRTHKAQFGRDARKIDEAAREEQALAAYEREKRRADFTNWRALQAKKLGVHIYVSSDDEDLSEHSSIFDSGDEYFEDDFEEPFPDLIDAITIAGEGDEKLAEYLADNIADISAESMIYLERSIDVWFDEQVERKEGEPVKETRARRLKTIECMWRFALFMTKYQWGDQVKNVSLAIHAYTALIDLAHELQRPHSFMLQALVNSREIARMERNRMQSFHRMCEANAAHEVLDYDEGFSYDWRHAMRSDMESEKVMIARAKEARLKQEEEMRLLQEEQQRRKEQEVENNVAALKMEENIEEDYLVVRILRGENWDDYDESFIPSPYVEISDPAGTELCTSSVKASTANPIWNEMFRLLIIDPASPLTCRVYDGSPDKLLGIGTLDLTDPDVTDLKPHSVLVTFVDEKEAELAGNLHLQVVFQPFHRADMEIQPEIKVSPATPRTPSEASEDEVDATSRIASVQDAGTVQNAALIQGSLFMTNPNESSGGLPGTMLENNETQDSPEELMRELSAQDESPRTPKRAKKDKKDKKRKKKKKKRKKAKRKAEAEAEAEDGAPDPDPDADGGSDQEQVD